MSVRNCMHEMKVKLELWVNIYALFYTLKELLDYILCNRDFLLTNFLQREPKELFI